jgi:hypothetical protein
VADALEVYKSIWQELNGEVAFTKHRSL